MKGDTCPHEQREKYTAGKKISRNSERIEIQYMIGQRETVSVSGISAH